MMNGTTRRVATNRVMDEWERLQFCWRDAAHQYGRRAISQNELVRRLADIVGQQLDVIRRYERSHHDLDDTVVMD